MTDLVEVVYVGKKPAAIDNVAHSGKLWNGKGDVQSVTPEQAKTLIKYPDQWVLVNPDDATAVAVPVTHTTTGEDKKPVQVAEGDLKKPLEKMSKPELVVYAEKAFGKVLDVTKSKKLLMDEIADLEKDVDSLV
jgi:hypothetical protein